MTTTSHKALWETEYFRHMLLPDNSVSPSEEEGEAGIC